MDEVPAKVRRAQKKAIDIATGKRALVNPSAVNAATEYGALFNKLNRDRLGAGLPPLKTAMEVLIETMQTDEISLKEKARIAEKLAQFESSRAPVMTIEYVQNMQMENQDDPEGALDDFLQALRKV